jgi:hypothetical protein
MNNQKHYLYSVLVAALVAAEPVSAVTIENITVTSLPGLVTVTGQATPSPSQRIAVRNDSLGEAETFAWLQTQIPSGYASPVNSLLASGLSAASLNLSAYEGSYLVLHWGLGEAGKFFDPNPQGGFSQAFYISPGEFTGLTTPTFSGFYPKNSSKVIEATLPVGGLSFWRVYGQTPPYTPPGGGNPVPEAATTLVLLGVGLAVIGGTRKLISR